MDNEKNKLIDKQAAKIARLEKRNAELVKQKENLKKRIERLKTQVQKKDLAYKKLEDKLLREDKIKQPPVKRLHSLYPNIAQHLSLLCQEWNIKTMNMRNTSMAIFRLIEPDENGVVEYKEQDIVEYIDTLRKLGKVRYMQNETLAHYYEPYDSLVLFKHFKNIRKNLHMPENDFGFGIATLNGKTLLPERKTAICSWSDLRKQRQGVIHANDSVNIEQFKGDDLIRERERRRVKQTGVYDEQAVIARIRYQAERYFGKDKTMQQIVENTPIMELEEDDDDLDISEFKEVK